ERRAALAAAVQRRLGVGPGSFALSARAWLVRGRPAYERLAVAAPPEAVVAALRDAIAARGITEYAIVDHGHDMAAAGAPAFTAWTLVFGNPAAGAELLARDLAAAVDIPLRLAVVAGEHGDAEIVLRDMRSLLGDDLGELADGLTAVLRSLASEARDRAAAG
ncbi:MAG TPA: DUF302 domain-containing protein, partial [Solirubrobacteraceae bacterium]